ncbi:sporulation protein rmd1 [Dimargaris xerosporica]|nr:sporulation protein rmd1 [Dimargaris xerosporica]
MPSNIAQRLKGKDRQRYHTVDDGDHSFPPAALRQRIAFPNQSSKAKKHSRLVAVDADTSATVTPALTPNLAKPSFRTSKTSQKLALFPDETQPEPADQAQFYEGEDVYNQLHQVLRDGPANHQIHADMWRRLKREALPRVSAYCVSTSFNTKALFKYLQSRKRAFQTAPKLMDECIYSPFAYEFNRSLPSSPHAHTMPLVDLSPGSQSGDEGHSSRDLSDQESNHSVSHHHRLVPDHLTSEVFVFDYGVVVLWAMSREEEKRFLHELRMFQVEPLEPTDVEVEEFNLYYNPDFPPMIYNDVIRLRHPNNYMVKMTISHAIAQSVKLTLYEELVEDTINDTKHIPQLMAETGRVKMSRTAITKKIGQLFIMRINVNLVSNILDTPEIFWSEPSLQPLYEVVRDYLEITQRTDVMNHRVSVISDLLDMLREHLNGYHGEFLEWIVIILIAIEIFIGLITISLEARRTSYG